MKSKEVPLILEKEPTMAATTQLVANVPLIPLVNYDRRKKIFDLSFHSLPKEIHREASQCFLIPFVELIVDCTVKIKIHRVNLREGRFCACRKSSHPELANDHSIPPIEFQWSIAAQRLNFQSLGEYCQSNQEKEWREHDKQKTCQIGLEVHQPPHSLFWHDI